MEQILCKSHSTHISAFLFCNAHRPELTPCFPFRLGRAHSIGNEFLHQLIEMNFHLSRKFYFLAVTPKEGPKPMTHDPKSSHARHSVSGVVPPTKAAANSAVRVQVAACLPSSGCRISRTGRDRNLSTRRLSNPVALTGEAPDTAIPGRRQARRLKEVEFVLQCPSHGGARGQWIGESA